MDIKNKNILVFGVGVSGVSAIKLAKQKGANVFVMSKGDPSSWNLDVEKNLYNQDDYSKLPQMDFIILSPGIPRDHEALSLQKKAPIISEIEFAYYFCQTPIIAITGTNGKTTTVSLLGEMIKRSNKKVFVGGNIGVAFSEYVLGPQQADYVLLELSSFQLESIIDFKPQSAAVLNIFANHGERYQGIDDYAQAKARIAMNMDESAKVWAPSNFKISTKAQVIKVDLDNVKIDPQFDLSEFKLVGPHNILNLYFCIEMGKEIGLSYEGMQEAINHFKGVAHRIEFVTDSPLTVYNDAKSTNLDATMVAVKAVSSSSKNLALIMGGQLRGRGEELTDSYIEELKLHCSKIYVIGDASNTLQSQLEKHMRVENAGTLDQVFNNLVGIDTLLFSPGFPSFDQFKNYVHRGEVFKELVASYSKQK